MPDIPSHSESMPPAKPRPAWQTPAICLLLALAVLAVFGQTARFEFVGYDDQLYVFENPVVLKGLSLPSVGWAFTHSQVANWIPLTTLSHMLDCDLFGERAGGHHLVNVLWHTANAVLLFLVLRQMTGSRWRSALIAALFAIHPLRAESVAWISERKDVLSGFFFLLTIGAYVRHTRHPTRFTRLALPGCFALGLMSKSMVATLPAVLLVLDYWPLGRLRHLQDLARLAREKMPLFALAAAACVVTALMPGLIVAHRTPLLERVDNALISYVIYLRQMLLPLNLAAHYPNPPHGPAGWKAALALILLTSISAAVVGFRKQQPWLLAGWLWYLGMLFPVIGLVQISSDAAHADRYTYLPEIGLAVAVIFSAAKWCAGARIRQLLLGGLAGAALILLALGAYRQVATWRNDTSLWTHALACTAGNSIAHNGLGVALAREGNHDAAIAEYHAALQINPNYPAAHYNLGDSLTAKGNLDGAIAQYQLALKIQPDYPGARNNLGVAYFKKGDKDAAIAEYRKALEFNSDDTRALFNLGDALMERGEPEAAIYDLRRALALKSDFAEGFINLGICLCLEGAFADAIPQFQRALQLNPDSLEARSNLANALVKTGNLDEALARYREVLEKNPDYPNACRGLAKVLLRRGDLDGAVANFQKTIRLSPEPFVRWNELGNSLLRGGEAEESAICYQEALKINAQSPATLDGLGAALARMGKTRQAGETWRRALEISPNQTSAQNHLAWLLATASDVSIRNGTNAVILATQANRATGDTNPVALRTLAAAYAETGRYADAAATAGRALQIAVAQKNEIQAAKLAQEVKLYEAGKPMREEVR